MDRHGLRPRDDETVRRPRDDRKSVIHYGKINRCLEGFRLETAWLSIISTEFRL
jgi:hypothetical protein